MTADACTSAAACCTKGGPESLHDIAKDAEPQSQGPCRTLSSLSCALLRHAQLQHPSPARSQHLCETRDYGDAACWQAICLGQSLIKGTMLHLGLRQHIKANTRAHSALHESTVTDQTIICSVQSEARVQAIPVLHQPLGGWAQTCPDVHWRSLGTRCAASRSDWRGLLSSGRAGHGGHSASTPTAGSWAAAPLA